MISHKILEDVLYYIFDVLGQRIEKREPGEGAESDAVTWYYFNDRWQVLMEADADEGAMLREFVYGNGIDEPLIMVNGMETGTPKYYYLQDHLGSTIALLDSEGEIAEWYKTDVYGKPTVYTTAWSVSDTITPPTNSTIAPLAYYADAAANWLIEQPFMTTKVTKHTKENLSTGDTLSLGGLALDNDGPVLQLAVFDPNTVLDTSYAMPVDPNSVIRRGDARVALNAESGGLKFETVAGDGIVSLTLHAVSATGGSALENPYLFTGRRVDWLDGGAKPIQINRHRAYDYETGRWLSVDPFGVVPRSGFPNFYDPTEQYTDGGSLYEYASSQPTLINDAFGLWGADVHLADTARWAKEVGMCFAGEIGRLDNSIDNEFATTPIIGWGIGLATELVGTAGGIVIGAVTENPALGLSINQAAGVTANNVYAGVAYWHFPGADVVRSVEPDSSYSKREINPAMQKGVCNLEQFARGLHQYQDSWAHQSNGKRLPFGNGMVGHSRDQYGWNTERWDDPTINPPPLADFVWKWLPRSAKNAILKKTRIMWVALSHDTDDKWIFSDDYYETRKRTKDQMRQFITNCPCIKSGNLHINEKTKCPIQGNTP